MLVVERKTVAKDISGGGQADQLDDFGVSISVLGFKRCKRSRATNHRNVLLPQHVLRPKKQSE